LRLVLTYCHQITSKFLQAASSGDLDSLGAATSARLASFPSMYSEIAYRVDRNAHPGKMVSWKNFAWTPTKFHTVSGPKNPLQPEQLSAWGFDHEKDANLVLEWIRARWFKHYAGASIPRKNGGLAEIMPVLLENAPIGARTARGNESRLRIVKFVSLAAWLVHHRPVIVSTSPGAVSIRKSLEETLNAALPIPLAPEPGEEPEPMDQFVFIDRIKTPTCLDKQVVEEAKETQRVVMQSAKISSWLQSLYKTFITGPDILTDNMMGFRESAAISKACMVCKIDCAFNSIFNSDENLL
jgi:hypothetical protein